MENNGMIVKDLNETVENAFLDYAAYTIQRRAIPDVRDGLKFSARQLLHAAEREHIVYGKPFKKGNKLCGAATFSYVHGDSSSYGVYVRMAKPFAYRYMLMEGQGNVGTVANPSNHAAARYLELRCAKITNQLFDGLNKDTIDEWEATYDNEGKFPLVLPSIGFYNIVNGCLGIGVACATSIPCFNLREVNQAIIKLIQNPDEDYDNIYCSPDFPTGGIIVNGENVKESIRVGTGEACRIRAKMRYDKPTNTIIVTEVPYSVYTDTICDQVNKIIVEDETCGIEKITDYSGQFPLLEIQLKKNANPDAMMEFLYASTSLESWYGINMTMLDEGKKPKIFGWREALLAYITHAKKCKRKEFQFDKAKLDLKYEIDQGLIRAISIIDDVVKAIKESSSSGAAESKLIKDFGFTANQAQAILNLKLQRLSRLDSSKIQKEADEVLRESNRIKSILEDESLFNRELIQIFEKVAKEFGDDRRTIIKNSIKDKKNISSSQKVELGIMNDWTIKMNSEGQSVSHATLVKKYSTTTDDYLYIFTSIGRQFGIKINNLIIGDNNLHTLIKMKPGETILNIYLKSEIESCGFIIMATAKGKVKKIAASEINGTKMGITIIKMAEDDSLVSAIPAKDSDKVVIVSECGKYIMFKTDSVNAIGRNAAGVGVGISNYRIVGAGIVSDETDDLVITSDGKWKRISSVALVETGRTSKGRSLKVDKVEVAGIFKAKERGWFIGEKDKILYVNKDIKTGTLPKAFNVIGLIQ